MQMIKTVSVSISRSRLISGRWLSEADKVRWTEKPTIGIKNILKILVRFFIHQTNEKSLQKVQTISKHLESLYLLK